MSNPQIKPSRKNAISPRALSAALIALHALLLTWSAVRNSVAFDEYAHLPAGVSYWRHREFGMLNLAPPLLRLWAAAPVVAAGAHAPALEPFRPMIQKDRYWAYGEAFLRENQSDYQRLFEYARCAMIPISCLGAWIVHRWSSRLYGDAAGVVSCAAYVLCPNICAHASLVGTDAGTAVAVLVAAWLWWRFCRAPSAATLALATMAVGLAHLCKFTAILLWPALIAIAICVICGDPMGLWRRIAIGLVVVAAGCVLMINLGYGFEGSFSAIGTYAPQSKAMTALFARLPARLPIPLPRQAVLGFDALKWEIEQGFPALLLGEQYVGAKWYYFPVALALKLPISTLALLALAGSSMIGIARRRRLTADEAAVISAMTVFMLGMMFFAGANLGVRYVLPVLPFAFILIGRVWPAAGNARNDLRWRRTILILVALLAIENLSVAPRYLTFLNVLAGGPSKGQYLLNDSNFDWGQGLIDLKRWMDANGVKRLQLGYFGRVDPSVYGIDYDLLTDVSGEPYIAISSYFLVGLRHRLPSRHGPTGWVQLDFYRRLQAKPRVAVVGGTIHIFRRDDVADAMREAADDDSKTRIEDRR